MTKIPTAAVKRRGGQRFTPEDDRRLEDLRLQFPGGKPHCGKGGIREVAEAMGRAKSSIQIRLQVLAARSEGVRWRYNVPYGPKKGRQWVCVREMRAPR
jgi:hypothetical protein